MLGYINGQELDETEILGLKEDLDFSENTAKSDDAILIDEEDC